uniref:Amine oxidase domain-containing protein n=1 Tax=Fagus sylvatica TaxID=28930 RepID=A0A2N9GZN4_FAGSY
MMEFFESLGVDMETSDMSFSVSLDKGQGCEWGSRNGLSSLFAQKKNVLNPNFWQMIREIVKFKEDVLRRAILFSTLAIYLEVLENNPDIDRNETLGQFINSRGYSELFQKAYLVPVCGSVWSCPSDGVMSFSAFSVLSFCRNHHLLQLFGRPQWLTVRWRSHCYVKKVREVLESKGCQIRTCSEVHSVSTNDEVHAPDAVKLLGDQATFGEMRILGAFQYVYSDIFLHRDKNLMPKNPAAWSAWNFLGGTENKVCLTYWLNVLQNIEETSLPFLVTLNPDHTPKHTLLKWSTGHPVPSIAASKASLEFDQIQGKRGIWFCGAYQGYGFHEDGLKAGMAAAHSLLGKSCALLSNPKCMVPSMLETGARLIVTRFLGRYISAGCLM